MIYNLAIWFVNRAITLLNLSSIRIKGRITEEESAIKTMQDDISCAYDRIGNLDKDLIKHKALQKSLEDL